MKRFFILFSTVFLFVSSLISCHIFDEDDDDPDRIRRNSWDYRNIPDSRNCGADESADFTVANGNTEIAPGITVTFRTDTDQFNFSYYKIRELPDRTAVRNFDFSSHDFVTLGMDRYNGRKTVVFENCRFKAFRNDAVSPDSAGKVYFVFNNCSFTGNVSSSYITLNNCKIGGFTSDAMNPLREFHAKNLYVY